MAVKIVRVDKISLNATHFAAMSKPEAIRAMKIDGILSAHKKNEDWAEKAYELCVEAVDGKKPAVDPLEQE